MGSGLPDVGEAVWHGDKLYSTCGDCGKLVRLNKGFFGSMHVCLTEAERAMKDGNIASEATIAQRLGEWDERESLLREFAKKMGMRNPHSVKVPRITKKLRKSQYLSPETTDWINDLWNLVKEIEDRPAGTWLTRKTMDSLGHTLGNLSVILKRVTIVEK